MKLLLLFVCVGLCLFDSLHAAAVDTVLKAADEPAPPGLVEDALNMHEDCHQPKQIGRCFALFHRYAYNVERRQCEEFIYGGCGANQNNFETKEDCERKCNTAGAQQDATEAATNSEVTTIVNDEVESAATTAKATEPKD